MWIALFIVFVGLGVTIAVSALVVPVKPNQTNSSRISQLVWMVFFFILAIAVAIVESASECPPTY